MYRLIFGLLYMFSLLPMRVLYWLSDLVAFFLYYVFAYRKEVVMANLLQAFPDKTEAERISHSKKILSQFHRQLDRDLKTAFDEQAVDEQTYHG